MGLVSLSLNDAAAVLLKNASQMPRSYLYRISLAIRKCRLLVLEAKRTRGVSPAHDVVNAVLHAMAKARESKGGITEDANRAFDEAVETIASALKSMGSNTIETFEDEMAVAKQKDLGAMKLAAKVKGLLSRLSPLPEPELKLTFKFPDPEKGLTAGCTTLCKRFQNNITQDQLLWMFHNLRETQTSELVSLTENPHFYAGIPANPRHFSDDFALEPLKFDQSMPASDVNGTLQATGKVKSLLEPGSGMVVISTTNKVSIKHDICLEMLWPKIYGDRKNDWVLYSPPANSSCTTPPMDWQKSSNSILAPGLKPSMAHLLSSCITSQHVEDHLSQSPDSREVWQVLENPNSSCGLARSLALRRRFLTAKKKAAQPMQGWIGDIRRQVREMEAIDIVLSEQDKIIALTMGLPSAYARSILVFDAIPDQFTFDNVACHLLDGKNSALAGQPHQQPVSYRSSSL
ncbi:hypothetical protein EVG20_g2404 [Dentipellis fragilis]|uniref:Uncharacterized protein n=1 Tax=Dentipellis fragilis TaxID=205917 RepID=A0A4Y9Z7W2_9AGAM|nr:hypothetical protein EVG20_g2404 [Dentipellis fragilis]